MYSLEITNQGEASPSPFIPANRNIRSEHVAPVVHESVQDLRHKKRKKWAIFIAVLAVLQLALVLVFALVVMKVQTPRAMVRSATFDTFEYNRSGVNPSFNFGMSVEFGVKNANFGPYKYEEFNVSFYYGESVVGIAVVSKSKAGLLATSEFQVSISLSSGQLSGTSLSTLAIDLSTGVLPLTSNWSMNGEVELLSLFGRKKSISVSCNMGINYSTRQLQDIKC